MRNQQVSTLWRFKIAIVNNFGLRREPLVSLVNGNLLLRKQFTLLSHPDMQRLLTTWERYKKALLLFQLLIDIGVIHMVLIWHACRVQEAWDRGGFHSNFRRSSERAVCVLLSGAVYEAGRGNPKVLGKLQDGGKASNMNHLRKAARNKQRYPKRKINVDCNHL